MNKHLSLFLIFVFVVFIVPADFLSQVSFERTYTGDRGKCVRQTFPDSGYIVAGYTKSSGAGGSDVYLIKTDSSGDTLWTRTYGGESNDEGCSVQQTFPDSGYIIAGYTESFGAGGSDVYLIKTDFSGDTLWTRTYGGESNDEGRSVQQTFPDSGYIVAGYTESSGAGGSDVYLIKTDSSGDTLWTRTYGGESNDEGHSVQQTEDGGYIITGRIHSAVYLVKTDSSGNVLWTRTYDPCDYCLEEGYSVQQTTDGGYIIAGYILIDIGYPRDVLLIKTDSSGDTLWTREYPGCSYSVQQTTDGGYVIAGYYGFKNPDVLLMKTNSSGDSLWTRRFGVSYWDVGYSVQQTEDEGYVIAGYSYSHGVYNVYLIKTDPDGMVGITDNNPPSLEPPRSWALAQNYPNPFNPSTTISFDIPGDADATRPVSLIVYDLRGRRVRTLVDSELEPGTHKIHWDGRNDRGKSVTSGIYLYTLKAGEKKFTRKMTILK